MILPFGILPPEHMGGLQHMPCAVLRQVSAAWLKVVFMMMCGLAASGAGTTVTAAPGEGAITGHVVVTKALTKKRVTMPIYTMRGVTLGSQEAVKPRGTDPEMNELSRVVIYLEGTGLNPGMPGKATLTQKNRNFEPEIVVIPVGSTVSFPNADVIFHNVFSLSKVKQFDLGFYPAGETRAEKFDRPGVVQVYCHLHSDMSAAILVLPTASWTRPARDGSFSLTGVPPGTYDLVAWHRSAGFFRRRVKVGSGATPAVEFVIPVRDLDSGGGLAAQSSR
jgi:plastocyanin